MPFLQRFKFKPRRTLRSLFPDLGAIGLACAVGIALWLTCTELYSEVELAAHLAQTTKHPPLQHEMGNFTFIDRQGKPDKPIGVWYYQPPNLPEDASIVFVMPGFERNGSYLSGWLDSFKQSLWIL